MPTVQLNTRIDKQTKLVGDKVIKKNGYTPTKIINLVWEYFCENENNPEKVDDFFSKIDKKDNEKQVRKMRALDKMLRFNAELVDDADANGTQVDKERLLGKDYCKKHQIVNSYHAKLNANEEKMLQSSSNKEIRDISYKERLKKYKELKK